MELDKTLYDFCNFWSETSIQNWLLLLTLMTTTITSFWLYFKVRNENMKKDLSSRLFSLQQLCFKKSFLEEFKFTRGWTELRDKYISSKATEEETEKCLQYDAYCEMLFNYLAEAYGFYKNEKCLLEYVAFKPWIRLHKLWWENPLQEHSNREAYDTNLCNIIDGWLK